MAEWTCHYNLLHNKAILLVGNHCKRLGYLPINSTIQKGHTDYYTLQAHFFTAELFHLKAICSFSRAPGGDYAE